MHFLHKNHFCVQYQHETRPRGAAIVQDLIKLGVKMDGLQGKFVLQSTQMNPTAGRSHSKRLYQTQRHDRWILLRKHIFVCNTQIEQTREAQP